MNKKYIPYGVIGLLVLLVLWLIWYIFLPHIGMMSDMKNMNQGEMTNMQNWIPFPWYTEAMNEHCKMMPWMGWCEQYVELQKKESMWGMNGMWMNGEVFDNDVAWLPDAQMAQIVNLKDGDTYKMEASAVKQEVWNRVIKRLAYNGMIPGPILQVEKWAKINVEFTNNLEIETTLHSHGLRLDDAKFDGVPTGEMWGEQIPMQPGESYAYELDFPDTGVYWYHPHMREDYTQEMWLYGNFSVTEEDYWTNVDKEEFMILDDFSMDDVFYKDGVNKTLMGRFGNIMMINNQEDYNLQINTWESLRMYITNVANTRTFDFAVEKNWKKQSLKLVWWDIGKIEKETMISSQIIAPAERYIVETSFDEPGQYIIMSQERILGKITVSWNSILWAEDTLRDNTGYYADIRSKVEEFKDTEADKKLRLTIDMKWMGSMDGMQGMMLNKEDADEIEWEDNMAMMNQMSSNDTLEWKLIDDVTQEENMDIEWKFKKWDFVKVEIFNDGDSMHPMQHPIHFHGQRFVVMSRDGVANDNLQWKDTVLVKNGEKIEVLIEMTNPWTWMSHCHIAEHLQSGMMMNFSVTE